MGHETAHKRNAWAEDDADGALFSEKAGDADYGERDNVIEQDCADKRLPIKAPREKPVDKRAEHKLDKRINKRRADAPF